MTHIQHTTEKNKEGKRPLFSIFIPTSGRVDLIRAAVQSVREQTCQDFEIVVSDSSGMREAREAAMNSHDSRIRFIFASKDKGPLDTFNIAVRAARGEYLLGLDDDNYLLPHALDLFKNAIAESDADIITANHLYYYDGDHPRRFLRHSIGIVPFSGEKKYIDPRDAVAGLFAFERRGPGCRLPRFHFSATIISRRVIEACLSRLGYILFPDLPNAHSLQPILFSHSKSCFFVDQPVVVIGRLGVSMSQVWSTAAHARFRREGFSFSSSPLRAYTRANAVLENYLRVKEVLPDLLEHVPIDYNRFAEAHMRELVYLDADVSTAYRNWREFFSFLKTLSSETRRSLGKRARRAALLVPFVFLARRTKLNELWRILYGARARSKKRWVSQAAQIAGNQEFSIPIPREYAHLSFAGVASRAREIVRMTTGKDIMSAFSRDLLHDNFRNEILELQ